MLRAAFFLGANGHGAEDSNSDWTRPIVGLALKAIHMRRTVCDPFLCVGTALPSEFRGVVRHHNDRAANGERLFCAVASVAF